MDQPNLPHVCDNSPDFGYDCSVTTFTILGGSFGLFLAMLLAMEAGQLLALRKRTEGGPAGGSGIVEGAVFGLLGLLLAFAFGGALGRFESRRAMAVSEGTALSTAIAYVDLLADEDQPALRTAYRNYLDARLATYSHIADVAVASADHARASALKTEIWTLSKAATNRPGREQFRMLLLPATNNALDLATARIAALYGHLPFVALLLIGLVAMACAAMAGYAMANKTTRQWLRRIMLAGVTSLTIYLLLDMEYPRFGLIRETAADTTMRQVRASLGE